MDNANKNRSHHSRDKSKLKNHRHTTLSRPEAARSGGVAESQDERTTLTKKPPLKCRALKMIENKTKTNLRVRLNWNCLSRF